MQTGYPFDGKKYEESSQCQRDWGTELLEELHLKGDESILDLGCGNGAITREIARRVPYGNVVGVDSSPSMLEAAKAHKTDNMELKLLDINEMDFDAEFDVVFSNAALHWVLDHKRLLKNVYNALNPRGFMRVQFATAGNASTFIEVVREVMVLPECVTWFKGFRWPWFIPSPEEYEALLSQTEFRNHKIWVETKDRYFPDEKSTASSSSPLRKLNRRRETWRSSGAFFQNSGISWPSTVVNRIPPNRFFEPGYSPRSSTTTLRPLLASVIAAAMPDGPAPTIIQSNFSSSDTWILSG